MSETITQPDNTRITLTKTAEYREGYANSVQVRLSVWDFFLVFGTLQQQTADEVQINNFQGIYLSPQQAKALQNLLNQNIAQYESTFGPINLDGPRTSSQHFVIPGNGPVH
jgi:flagellar protein FlaG